MWSEFFIMGAFPNKRECSGADWLGPLLSILFIKSNYILTINFINRNIFLAKICSLCIFISDSNILQLPFFSLSLYFGPWYLKDRTNICVFNSGYDQGAVYCLSTHTKLAISEGQSQTWKIQFFTQACL